jgi:hypothetical protein
MNLSTPGDYNSLDIELDFRINKSNFCSAYALLRDSHLVSSMHCFKG